MTCSCSRLKYKLNFEGHYDNTLHCDQKGNFEPLQCNNGICWCANTKTGQLIKGTRAVPSTMWKLLPCCKFIIFIYVTYIHICNWYLQYLHISWLIIIHLLLKLDTILW